MQKSELIKKINSISIQFDSKSYSVDSNVFYKNKKNISDNALVITNIYETYHLLIEEINDSYKIYSVKDPKNIFVLSDDLQYIPDFKKNLEIKSIYNAVGKLYAELERQKIIKLLLDIKEKYINQLVDEKGLINLIIEEANESYGITAYKEKNKFIFETTHSYMEIRNIKEKDKRIYKIYINDIFIFQFEKFLDAVEGALIELVKNRMKKISKRSSRESNINLKSNPALRPNIKEI
jgi:hypothetical protein